MALCYEFLERTLFWRRLAAAHHTDMDKLIEIAKAGRAELHSLFEQDRT